VAVTLSGGVGILSVHGVEVGCNSAMALEPPSLVQLSSFPIVRGSGPVKIRGTLLASVGGEVAFDQIVLSATAGPFDGAPITTITG